MLNENVSASAGKSTPVGGRLAPRDRTVRVLGIDPGLRRTGVAVASVSVDRCEILSVVHLGVIETERDKHRALRKTGDDMRRAKIQAQGLSRLIEEHSIGALAMEMSTTTPYTLPTFSFGVMVGIVSCLPRPLCQVLPHEVKLAATGNPRCTKREVIEWALTLPSEGQVRWPTSTRPNELGLRLNGKWVTRAAEHPADALAAIAAALQTDQFELAVALTL